MAPDNGEYSVHFRKKADVRDGKPGLWDRIPVIWKAVGLIVAIAAMGGSAVATASQFVTQDDLAKHSAKETVVNAQIQSLSDRQTRIEADIAATRTDIAAVKNTAEATREDIRLLTKFLLEQSSRTATPAPRPRTQPRP